LSVPFIVATLELLTTLTSRNAPPHPALARAIRLLLGFILVVAAILKTYGAWRGEVPELPVLQSRYAQVALVDAELILGTWLISGLAPRYSYLAALLAFSAFFVAASYEVILQARSCGCFGPIPVSPKVTAGMDAVALLTLFICRRACQSEAGIPRAAQRLIIITGCVLALAAPVLMLRPGQSADSRHVMFLEPAKWPGSAFPLEKYVNDDGQLRQGNWLVMLYRDDCPVCESAMPSYLELARRVAAKQKRPARIAFVELPPSEKGMPHDANAYWFSLADSKEWAVMTPVVVLLRDGKVESAFQGEAAAMPPAEAERWLDDGQ
jgi:hypothetical protein